MKTTIRTLTVAAALIGVAPLLCLAQNSASQAGLVDRSVERLTLLPGPYLLSPARTTPTMMPSPIKLDTAPGFRFVPGPPPSPPAQLGSLKLIHRQSDTPVSVPGRVMDSAPPVKHPSLDSLRFDATLESPRVPSTIQFKFVPGKRD
jgi:hypothetical protein